MIDSSRLLGNLTKLLTTLEEDLHQQVHERSDVRTELQEDYEAARRVGRTQDTFETWSKEPITQASVAWLLGTVYLRFLEDNALVDPMLSGTGACHTRAQHEHQHYFQQHPTNSERHYLEHLFGRLAAIPATAALFDRRHNPLWRLPLSADAARDLVEFWQRIDPDTGQIVHDFADSALDTRFLGDLYQDLSEPVRKRYALFQTPRFVEAFILDRTLTPAIEIFGYRRVRLIDPTCGSGHFLLGTFNRLLALAQEHEPGKDVRVLVQEVLSRVAGVDVNPYAVAIAHFRLMVAAVRACRITRLLEAPGFELSVVAADSLLHGPRFADDGSIQMSVLPDDPANQFYFAEDVTHVNALLGRQYHAVVGNPPYITVKDPALRDLYRQRYGSCSGKYALVVPFLERFFELALPPEGDDVNRAGFIGLIVGNSFMKRDFGRNLIEDYFPRWDLTCVIDTAAHIPNHGTPTAILFGRHRSPESPFVRTVMGIRGEKETPPDPAKGHVWRAVLDQIDQPGSTGTYVSVSDVARDTFHRHPWSIGGGGASELKELLDGRGAELLGNTVESIGITSFTLEDDLYLLPRSAAARHRIDAALQQEMVVGDALRDWVASPCDVTIFPYDSNLRPIDDLTKNPRTYRHLWVGRTCLANNIMFGGKTKVQSGLHWYEFGRLTAEKLRTPLSIAFAFVATHNHFVLDRGGKVFKRSAPVIKLKDDVTEDDHLALLGLLNSSTACFWMKQVCHDKGGGGIGGGLATEDWEHFWEFTAGALMQFPMVGLSTDWAARLDMFGREYVSLLQREPWPTEGEAETLLQAAIAAQEELDWQAYFAYGLTGRSLAFDHMPPEISVGQRAFEIVMARKVASDEIDTVWFKRHNAIPTPDLPNHWPDDYRALVADRISVIESDATIALLEQPKHKRRWTTERFEDRLRRHLRGRLCDHLESADYWPAVNVTSVAKLADIASQDSEFMRVAERYTADPTFDVVQLVEGLVRDEAVPFLAVLRHKDSGLEKRAQWDRTWNLQRQEDAGEKVGDVPVPPKYTSKNFKSSVFWRLRGKLDVPKERFISFPGCERVADGSLPIAWAGWDHAQQARALGAYYMQIQGEEGPVPQKLVPLLGGLLELLPWVRQWHSGPDAEFGLELGDYYAHFVDNEARALGLTVDQLRAWRPEVPRRRGKKRRQA